MNGLSRKNRISLAALTLLLAVARLLTDRNDAGGPWTIVAAIALAVILFVLIGSLVVRVMRRRRLQTLPVVDEVRRQGATAFMCIKDLDPEYLVVSVGAHKDLTVARVQKGTAVPWLTFGATTYQLSHLAPGTSAPRLRVQSREQSFDLNVIPDAPMAVRPTAEQRAQMDAAIQQLITASR
ncbi:hypothetical protein [Oryzihumus leptocrescens]|uniref:Uncharacterized protein n=1 Tax=Oryzihumus leptocrescens TaxID=297536 RepID=A0A542ZNR1_9MICO|nr:hypothetical protein [Oryzihumus leptocrescens]TQL61919.1 hypothetical protein FB474_3343 [Oryzihumus leptocrescens]